MTADRNSRANAYSPKNSSPALCNHLALRCIQHPEWRCGNSGRLCLACNIPLRQFRTFSALSIIPFPAHPFLSFLVLAVKLEEDGANRGGTLLLWLLLFRNAYTYMYHLQLDRPANYPSICMFMLI